MVEGLGLESLAWGFMRHAPGRFSRSRGSRGMGTVGNILLVKGSAKPKLEFPFFWRLAK